MEGDERKGGEGEEFEFKNYVPTRCITQRRSFIILSRRYTHNNL